MKRKGSFPNKHRTKKLQDLSELSGVQDAANNLTERCTFNFSYFDCSQECGVEFFDLSASRQKKVIQSLVDYSKNSLSYWEGQGETFVVYDNFPPTSKTEFFHPKHVPHDVCWCRFRLAAEFRLIGFTVPGTLHEQRHDKTKKLYSANTFYVVFLDPKHKFWKSRKKHT